MKPNRLRSVAINLSLSVLSVAVTLLVVEGVMRLLGISSREMAMDSILVADEHTGFRLRPGAQQGAVPGIMPDVTINANGMRDRVYSNTKPEGTVRVLALGDSFAYGRVHHDFNFLTLLENRLDDATGNAQIEILNSGVPGYQPVNEAAYLEHYGFGFEPDIVLFCLYAGNDLRENDKSPAEINASEPVQRDGESAVSLPMSSVLGWSELYWTIANLIGKANLIGEIEKRMPEYSVNELDDPRRIVPDFWFMTEEQYNHVLADQMRNHLPPRVQNDWDRQNLKNTFLTMLKMESLCQKHGAAFAVALLPSELQVDETVRQQFIQAVAGQVQPGDLDFEEPQKTLKNLVTDISVPVIDLLPAFVEKGKTERLYLLRDSHWNERGNEVAADVIYEPLLRMVEERVSVGE